MAFSLDYFNDMKIDEGSLEANGEALTEREKNETSADEGKKDETVENKKNVVFPPEVFHHIVSFLDFNNLNKMRLVSRELDGFCKYLFIKRLNIVRGMVIRYLRVNQKKLFDDNAYSNTTPLNEVLLIKQEVIQSIMICLRVVTDLLERPIVDEQFRFDAGKVVYDAAHLFYRMIAEKKIPDSFEEIIPESFFLFEKVIYFDDFCGIPFDFHFLKELLLERSLRRNEPAEIV